MLMKVEPIYAATNVPVGVSRDADLLENLQTHTAEGLINLAAGCLFRLTFNITESGGAADAVVKKIWQVLSRITIRTKTHTVCNNVTGLGLALQGMMDGLFKAGNVADFSTFAAQATGGGPYDVAVTVLVPFAMGPFHGDMADLEGAIPLSELKEDSLIRFTLGDGTVGTTWDVTGGLVATAEVVLLTVQSAQLPEPVFRQFFEKDEYRSQVQLQNDRAFPTRLLSLLVRSNDDTDYTPSTVTSMSFVIDDVVRLPHSDGELRAVMDGLMTGLDEIPFQLIANNAGVPDVLPVISRVGKTSDMAEVIRNYARLEDAGGGSGSYPSYIAQHWTQHRPTRNMATAIKLRNGIPQRVIDAAYAEESEERARYVAYANDVPITVTPANRFVGRSSAMLPIIY